MLREQVQVVGYEKVYQYIDDGFHAFIAIHSTRLGPALGGCRIRSYDTDADALADVLKLARGMTYKNAAAGLNFGGGKCVVNAAKPTQEIMLKVGEIVEQLGGEYITGEDVGTSVPDIQIAAEKTSHVLSLGAIGDPSPWTALGVFECIMSVRVQRYLSNTPLHVWVQGLGKVGWALSERLHRQGFKLYVSDIDANKVAKAQDQFQATVYADHMFDEIDIYAPCALGNVIHGHNFDTIAFPIICGSANNQLADDCFGDRLHERGILYCPDYIVNAGGVIAAAGEISGASEDQVRKDVMNLGNVLVKCFVLGEKYGNRSPLWGAHKLANDRLSYWPMAAE